MINDDNNLAVANLLAAQRALVNPVNQTDPAIVAAAIAIINAQIANRRAKLT